LYNFCKQQAPETAVPGIATFVEMVFSAFLTLKLQFGFQREGSRGIFYGIQLETTINRYESNDEMLDEGYGNGNVATGHKQHAHSYRRKSNLWATAKKAAETLYSEGYIKEAIGKKVRVFNLQGLYEAISASAKNSVPFSDVLDELLTANKSLSREKKTDKKGKPHNYIVGLVLTDKAKALLEELE
jgi:hypothetical protein